jgi:hypothetical protein
MPSSGNAVSVAYKARLIGPFGSLLIQQSSAYGEYSGDLLYEAPIIGPGESITIENLDGAESLDVVVTYADFANPDLTLFRQQTNGTNLVTLIPAAPVGKVNIAASVMPERSYPLSSAEKGSTVFYFNADDVAHSAQIRNAGKLINNYPTGAVSPNSATELEIVSAIDSTGLLTAQLREATNSVEGYLFGAYLEVSST